MLLGAKIKYAFVTDLWTAMNDLPLVPSGLIFSSVCVCIGNVLGISAGEIKC